MRPAAGPAKKGKSEMPNIAVVLKEEIARVARKSVKKEIEALKKSSVQARRDVSELRKQVADLSRKLAAASRGAAVEAKPAAEGAEDARVRFTAKGLKSQRERLELSAADYGKLAGVSSQSIYKWERGLAQPRAKQVARLAELRKLGKKEALARLGAK